MLFQYIYSYNIVSVFCQYIYTYNIVLVLFQGVGDCCLTPIQQFSSYIMARTSWVNCQWDDAEVRFVLDQHAE